MSPTNPHRSVLRPRFAAVLVLGAVLSAAATAQTDPGLVETLYLESGMEKQFASLPAVVQADFMKNLERQPAENALRPRVVERLHQAIGERYAVSEIKPVVLDFLGRGLEAHDVEQVLAWLRSPLGRKLIRLEEEASTPEAVAVLTDYARTFADTPPPRPRLDQVARLAKSVRVVEGTIKIAMNTQLGVITALVMSTPDAPPDALARAMRQVERSRPHVERLVVQQTLLSLLYTYRDVPAAELSRYVDFARSASGVKYHEVTMEALDEAMTRASRSMGRAITEIMKEERAKRDT